MTKVSPFVLALGCVLGSSQASADPADAGGGSCDEAGVCEAGADAQGATMQPPEEDDPGGCACWWGESSSGPSAALALLVPVAWLLRHKRR